MTSLRYFLPTSQLKGKQMAARLLKDIVPGAWGENLTPLESRGGRRGAGRARRTLDATFHFILLPHLPPATEPSFGIFSQGTDLGHSLSSCSRGQQQHPLNLPLVVPWALKTLLSIGWLMQKEDSPTRLASLAHHSPKKTHHFGVRPALSVPLRINPMQFHLLPGVMLLVQASCSRARRWVPEDSPNLPSDAPRSSASLALSTTDPDEPGSLPLP